LKESRVIPVTCPCVEKAELQEVGDEYVCQRSGCPHSAGSGPFRKIAGIPVLISSEKCDTVCDPDSVRSYVSRPLGRFTFLRKVVVGESRVTREKCAEFIERLKKLSDRPRVLVIGSGERGSGTESLWGDEQIEIHGVDIYASDSVDVVCDAHYLPLQSGFYDGVWI